MKATAAKGATTTTMRARATHTLCKKLKAVK